MAQLLWVMTGNRNRTLLNSCQRLRVHLNLCFTLNTLKMKIKWNLILVLSVFLIGSCGLIDEKDTFPQNRENAEMIKSDDYPARGDK